MIKLCRFKRFASLRPVLIANSSATFTEENPAGPEKEKMGVPTSFDISSYSSP